MLSSAPGKEWIGALAISCAQLRSEPSRDAYSSRFFARAFAIRASVLGLRTAHSLIRKTVHPSRLNDRVTRLSRDLLLSILLRQKSALVRGRYLQRHPCQKHPSTKTATLRLGHAKSGLPATGQCFRYPRIPAARRSLSIGNSVVVLPRECTAAMILERISFVT